MTDPWLEIYYSNQGRTYMKDCPTKWQFLWKSWVGHFSYMWNSGKNAYDSTPRKRSMKCLGNKLWNWKTRIYLNIFLGNSYWIMISLQICIYGKEIAEWIVSSPARKWRMSSPSPNRTVVQPFWFNLSPVKIKHDRRSQVLSRATNTNHLTPSINVISGTKIILNFKSFQWEKWPLLLSYRHLCYHDHH